MFVCSPPYTKLASCIAKYIGRKKLVHELRELRYMDSLLKILAAVIEYFLRIYRFDVNDFINLSKLIILLTLIYFVGFLGSKPIFFIKLKEIILLSD